MAWRAALAAHPRPAVGFAWQAGQQGIGLERLRQDVLSQPGTLISLMTGKQQTAIEAYRDILNGGLHLRDWQDACAAVAVRDLFVLPSGPWAQLGVGGDCLARAGSFCQTRVIIESAGGGAQRRRLASFADRDL